MELLHLILKTLDTAKGYNVSYADQQDSGADEGGKGDGGHVRIAEAQDTQDYTGDTKEEEGPPVRESHFLVVEAVDGHKNAFYDDPDYEDNRQRRGNEQVVAQEDDTDDNLKDGAEHAAGAVGEELLGLESEDELGDTRQQREAADGPGGCKEGCGGFADAHNAKGYQENTRNAQPDFARFLHWLKGLVFN